MDSHDSISDDEFVPFLRSLGVETYKKSFEWMLSDPDFSGVLHWLYNNLDHNNALSAREECRYAELQKNGHLLSQEQLEESISSIQEKYNGICLPGDQQGLECVKLDILKQKQRLNLFEKNEKVTNEFIKQNQQWNEELSVELSKLRSAQQQCADKESEAAEQCLALAEEVETLTDSVVDVVARTLDMYSSCHEDKEVAKKYLTFSPLESYRQSQSLFKLHFDLYMSRKFNQQNDNISDDDMRAAVFDARRLEDGLSDAVSAYVESKANLSGEQAKLALVSNYSVVHPSQLTAFSVEAQTALDLLAQEETILDQEIQAAIKDLVTSRTRLTVDTATRSVLVVREQILSDLVHLLDTSQQALALDRVLYCAVRHELRTVEQMVQFAAQLRQHVAGEAAGVASRIETMKEIIAEQETCEHKLKSSDMLTNTLYELLTELHQNVTTLGDEQQMPGEQRKMPGEQRKMPGEQRKMPGETPNNDPLLLVKLYNDLQSDIKELRSSLEERYIKKRENLQTFKSSYQPLREFIYDGCTRQANCWDRDVAALVHALSQDMQKCDKRVREVGSLYTSVKKGDKQNLRKLWQWFLTDQTRLLAAVRGLPYTS